MGYKTQTVALHALVLMACRAEPSRAPEADEQSVPPLAQAPAQSATTPPSGGAPSGGSGEVLPSSEPRSHQKQTFDDNPTDTAPPGFSFGLTGKGATGKWVVKAEAAAPSGSNVLAQLDPDATNFRFPVAVLVHPVLQDVRVSVRCKLVSGRVDQACGLVARYRDQNNYLVTRANALEDNIRLYTVKDGKRSELASHDIEVSPNVWHDYRFQLRGDHLQVFWNGERVLDHHDQTFAAAGAVGVWTKADSITHFDDLTVEAFE